MLESLNLFELLGYEKHGVWFRVYMGCLMFQQLLKGNGLGVQFMFDG
jgi:hypothetical protein